MYIETVFVTVITPPFNTDVQKHDGGQNHFLIKWRKPNTFFIKRSNEGHEHNQQSNLIKTAQKFGELIPTSLKALVDQMIGSWEKGARYVSFICHFVDFVLRHLQSNPFRIGSL